MTDTATPGSSDTERNLNVVTRFWEALGRRDFDAVGAFMAPEGHYIDVPVLGAEPGATGPAEVAARLRLGLGPLERYVLHDGPMVATGDMVVTEHSEEWFWHTGEHVELRFCSVMQLADGQVTRWWDYLDFAALMATAPQWWLDHIASGYR